MNTPADDLTADHMQRLAWLAYPTRSLTAAARFAYSTVRPESKEAPEGCPPGASQHGSEFFGLGLLALAAVADFL
jgi:hypothetical protein